MDLPDFDPIAATIGLAAFVTACGVVYRYVWTPVVEFNRKINRGMDTLLGYHAVTDPATGRVIQPATPPLANRVYDLEEAQTKIANALDKLANIHNDVVELQQRSDERERQGLQILHEWTSWREKHEEDAAAREQRLAEWEVWRSEQTLLGQIVRENMDIPTKDPK